MAALLVWDFAPVPTATGPWIGRVHNPQTTADDLLAEHDEDVACNCTQGYYSHILWDPPWWVVVPTIHTCTSAMTISLPYAS